MEDRKDQKNAPWLSVPQFGDWDQKGELPDYSVDFSKIREMRKQNKRDASRASLGKEEELINPTATTAKPAQTHDHHHHYHQDHHDSPTVRFFQQLYLESFFKHNVPIPAISMQAVAGGYELERVE